MKLSQLVSVMNAAPSGGADNGSAGGEATPEAIFGEVWDYLVTYN